MPWSQQELDIARKRLGSEPDPQKRAALEAAIRKNAARLESGSIPARAPIQGDTSFLDFDPSKAPRQPGEHATPPPAPKSKFETFEQIGSGPQTPEASQHNFALSRATADIPEADRTVDPAAIGRTASGLGAFRDLPERWAPGDTFDRFRTKYVLEPSLEQYVADMGDASGLPGPLQTMTDQEKERFKASKPFQIYADRMWQKELEAAKAEKRPVVRQKFASGLDKILAEGTLGSGAFGLGFADMASAGIATGGGGRIAEAVEGEDSSLSRGSQERIREEYPILSTLGGIGGALTPTGAPSLAARGAYGGLKKVAPSLTKSAAKEAVAAGSVGAATAAGESLVRDAAYGNDLSPERAGLAAALGGPIAGGTALVGRAIGKTAAASADRPGMREVIYPADEAGVAFGPAMGPRLPGAAKKLRDEAIEAGHAADAEGYAISKVEKPFAEAGRKLQEADVRPAARRLELSQKLQRQSRFEPANTGKSLLDMLRRGVQESGKDVPFEKGLPELRKQVANIYDHVPATEETLSRVKASRPNAVVLDADEAERLGLGHLTEGNPYVVLSPSPKTPEELDKIIGNIDDLAKADSLSRGGKLDPRYKQLMADARRDRDLIPARPKNLPVEVDGKPLDMEYELGSGERVRGYSALKTDAEDTIRRARERNVAAGLPGEVPKPAPRPVRSLGAKPLDETLTASPDGTSPLSPSDAPTRPTGPSPRVPGKGEIRGEPIGEPAPKLLEEAGQWDTLRGKLRDYGRTGGSPASRKAIQEIARSQPGLMEELGTIRALGLEKKAETLGTQGGLSAFASSGGGLSASVNPNLLNHLSFRSLPLRAALAGEEGTGGTVSTIAQAVSPKLKQILRRMRGKPGLSEEEGRKLFGDSTVLKAKSPNLSRFALRGGRTGATANAGTIPEAEEEAELTPEDVQNLQILIEATK